VDPQDSPGVSKRAMDTPKPIGVGYFPIAVAARIDPWCTHTARSEIARPIPDPTYKHFYPARQQEKSEQKMRSGWRCTRRTAGLAVLPEKVSLPPL
jgi:hypothetical protein